MERQIDLIAGQGFSTSNYSFHLSAPSANFEDVLSQILRAPLQNTETQATPRTGKSPLGHEATDLFLVGRTTENTPTVSHVILDNSTLKDKGWQIILSDINKEKAYTTIPLGSEIYYNSSTGELSWSKSTESGKHLVHDIPQGDNPVLPAHPATIKKDREKVLTLDQPLPQTERSLGRLDSRLLTVSHLLAASPEFSAEKWNILAHQANKDKDFSSIPVNAEILINPDTMELSWQQTHTASPVDKVRLTAEKHKNLIEPIDTASGFSGSGDVFINSSAHAIGWFDKPESPDASPFSDDTFPPDLTEAVKPFIGRPYHEIDCYGLVVKGLKEMGLPYSGKDGLRNRLTAMARERGLPANAYLTGEGIIKATGKQVFTQAVNSVRNSEKEAEKTFQDMKPVLQKGQILSFSTPTRGHTGIVSQHNEQWTFINSGRMDNNVSETALPEEVGEEDLYNEVRNWFKLAEQNKESLIVTLGEIESNKIRSTLQPGFQLSQRM